MNRIRAFFLGSMFFALMVCQIGRCSELDDNADKGLWSADVSVRESAAHAIDTRSRRALFQCCQVILEGSDSDDKALAAKTSCWLLGRFRSREAVPVLVDKLTLSIPREDDFVRMAGLADRYPCAAALIEIGLPAIDPVVAKAEQSDDNEVMKVSCIVIQRVLGDVLGNAYLADRIAKQTDSKRKAKLERMQVLLDQSRRSPVSEASKQP